MSKLTVVSEKDYIMIKFFSIRGETAFPPMILGSTHDPPFCIKANIISINVDITMSFEVFHVLYSRSKQRIMINLEIRDSEMKYIFYVQVWIKNITKYR